MLARAIAKDAGFKFLVVQPSVVNNKYIGESEKLIQVNILSQIQFDRLSSSSHEIFIFDVKFVRF